MAFNLVGALGILIQLATLAVLTGWLGVHYLVGTGLAVEAAVLHNFIWHEHWTWSDRSDHDKEGMWKRLVRFHVANGALSIGGNLILMRLFVGSWSMNYAVANIVTIAICSFLNFLASDRFVFQPTPRASSKRRASLCASPGDRGCVTAHSEIDPAPGAEGRRPESACNRPLISRIE
jgi:putative flippase GtrA